MPIVRFQECRSCHKLSEMNAFHGVEVASFLPIRRGLLSYRFSLFIRSMLGAAGLLGGSLHAIGLSTVDEASPFQPHVPTPAHQQLWRLATGIVLGSNYVSYSGAQQTKEDDGRVAFTNWVNNGEFAYADMGGDWSYKGALVQRNSWVSVHGDNRFPSYVGLTSIWIDNTFRYHRKDSPWTHAIVLSPGLSSDFKVFHGESLRLPVYAGSRYRLSSSLELELGITYAEDFVQAPVLPVLGFTFTPSENWELRYRFTTVEISRLLAPRTRFGAFVSYDSASWVVGKEDEHGLLAYSAATAGLELTHGFDLSETLPAWVSFAAGSSWGGSVRRYDIDGSKLLDSLQLDPGYFLRFGLVIRF